MRLFWPQILLICFFKHCASKFVEPRFRYLNFEGIEVRFPVSTYLARDAIHLILGAEAAAKIIFPDDPVVSLTYGNLVDTSLLLSEYFPEGASHSYNGFLRISLPNLRRQPGDGNPFTLPVHSFFEATSGPFFDPFFNENVPMHTVDYTYFIGTKINMTMDKETLIFNGPSNVKCQTREGDKEDMRNFLQKELYVNPSGRFAPKICEVPEFCDSIAELLDSEVTENLFLTKQTTKTPDKLCRGYLSFEFSDLFRHFTLLEGLHGPGITTGLYMHSSIWIGVNHED